MITENPFKESGGLKSKFAYYNNTLWFAGGIGGKDLPAFKSCRLPWTASDCPHQGKKLKLLGVSSRELSERLGLAEKSVERFIFNGPIPRKHFTKLLEIEKEFTGGE
jgi:hypothetical protein